MIDDKIKLEDYFKEEIKRVSNIEIEQVEKEIALIRENSIQDMEKEAQHDAGIVLEHELKEMMSEHAIALSKTHEETNRKLMHKRKELADCVFQEAITAIQAFTLSDAYASYLIKKVKEMASASFGNIVIYVAKKDEALLTDLCNAYGAQALGKVDLDILVGGWRLECEEKGIVIDETFDASIEEQRSWFYTNSGLFIK